MMDLSEASEAHVLPDQAAIRRVQVGCGPHHHRAGWWNTDLRPFEGIDGILDACQPWPWQDQLDYIYAEHFLEHLTLENAMDFLCAAGKALKVDGRLRLTTPSLEWVLKTHVVFDPANGSIPIDDNLRLNRAFHGWGHCFLYSAATLRTLLERLGYVDVQFFEYGASNDPVLRGLELHGEYSFDCGYPSVWIVEAAKSTGGIVLDPTFQSFVEGSFNQYLRGGH